MRVQTAFFTALLFLPFAAGAQPPRVFVASNGNDSAACSRVAPCRNFDAALAAVQSGGEVVVLDSASYGATTITKDVTVVAPVGVYARVAASSGAAITINAPNATVVLRGLTIRGSGGVTGVLVNSVGALHIDSCEIAGFTQDGVSFTTAGALFVDDTTIRENGSHALYASPSAGTFSGTVSRSRFAANDTGVVLSGLTAGPGSTIAVFHSTVTENSGYGLWVQAAGANVKSCTIAHSSIGINADAGATMTVSDSSISTNSYGIYCDSSTCGSFGDNELTANTTDKHGVVAIAPQ